MEQEIDRSSGSSPRSAGLSENYQLSTRRSLTNSRPGVADAQKITQPRNVTLPLISEYLGARKRRGLSASSIKLDGGGVEDFFSVSCSRRGRIERDPTETLTLPRIERYLPETLNELQVEQLIESIDTNAAARAARSRDCRAALRERTAHFGTGKCAAGKFQRRRSGSCA